MWWTDALSAMRSMHIRNNATKHSKKHTCSFKPWKLSVLAPPGSTDVYFLIVFCRPEKSITTMFREESKKPSRLSIGFRFWGLFKASDSSSTLLEAHLLPVHQETKLLIPTSATDWSLSLLHVQVLWAHFPFAASLVWWRSVPVPCVTHWGAQVTARSRTSGHCPLRLTQKAAFIFTARGLTLQEWFYSVTHTSKNSAGSSPFFFFNGNTHVRPAEELLLA